MSNNNSYSTIVIGGGQAGLAVGYYLARQSQNFIILDGSLRVGDTWRRRWDSLRLFTPAKFNGLPGLPFPAPGDYLPTKDEVADYLETYCAEYNLPVRSNTPVKKLSRNGAGYQVTAGDQTYHANNIIVATGAYQVPNAPPFTGELDPSIVQLHSSAYRNPGQLPAGRILVVGAGNSGAEVSLELSRSGRQVWLSGRDVGHIPADRLGKHFDGRPYWWFISRVLSIDTPIGRKMQSQVQHHGNPLIRSDRKEILDAGIQIEARLAGVSGGKPLLPNGQSIDVDAVVWATGFRPDFCWIELPIFDAYGLPKHRRGVVPDASGLYFVGLHFQTGLTSALMGGVGKDAQYITSQIH